MNSGGTGVGSYLLFLASSLFPVCKEVGIHQGFPGGSDSKESACSAGYPGFDPGDSSGYPLQYSCLENSVNIGAFRLLSLRLQRVRHD